MDGSNLRSSSMRQHSSRSAQCAMKKKAECAPERGPT